MLILQDHSSGARSDREGVEEECSCSEDKKEDFDGDVEVDRGKAA